MLTQQIRPAILAEIVGVQIATGDENDNHKKDEETNADPHSFSILRPRGLRRQPTRETLDLAQVQVTHIGFNALNAL